MEDEPRAESGGPPAEAEAPRTETASAELKLTPPVGILVSGMNWVSLSLKIGSSVSLSIQWTTDEDLDKLFSEHGRVTRIRFFDDKINTKSKGYQPA